MRILAKRLLWRLRRAVPLPIDRAVTIDGLILRDATPADTRALAELHVKTFHETHRPPFGSGPSVALRESQWREKLLETGPANFVLVLESPRQELVGFAWVHPTRDNPSFAVRLNKIYLLASYQRRGLGRRLMREIVGRLLRQGLTSMVLFTEVENIPACAFYESLGAERIHGNDGKWDGMYGWRNLTELDRRLRAG